MDEVLGHSFLYFDTARTRLLGAGQHIGSSTFSSMLFSLSMRELQGRKCRWLEAPVRPADCPVDP